MHPSIDSPAGLAREIVARSVAIVGLADIALIHLLDSLGKFQETPYMGWMYVGLMLSCLAVAAALVRANLREAWLGGIPPPPPGDPGLRPPPPRRPAAGDRGRRQLERAARPGRPVRRGRGDRRGGLRARRRAAGPGAGGSRTRHARHRALTFAEPLPGTRDAAPMPHLSELHGAATHLAVVAVPV